MGRGVLSKSIRAQNRATAAGHPTRHNPYANNTASMSRREQSQHKKRIVSAVQRYLVHDNKNYRMEYMIQSDKIVITGIVYYPNPHMTTGGIHIKGEELRNQIAKRLLITLMVEEAQKNQ